ncbi:MAG: 3-phosphoshikimate 1-carboxyvinyltransferase [Acidobacteriota bacterium]
MLRAPVDTVTVNPASRAAGRVRVPGDKSISHRYALFAALADGESFISGYSSGADCAATLGCLRGLGVDIRTTGPASLAIAGRGLGGLRAPFAPLDAVNSGTTIRLLSGILAGHPFRSVVGGDESLQRRPMRRIIEPLTRMGARIHADGGRAPLTIDGGGLQGITHEPAVPSAQVKSGVLLAGLHASGRTRVVEPAPTRDHTERALSAFGAEVLRDGLIVEVAGGQRLAARTLTVPGDISGAAFWAALAGGTSGAVIDVDGVGLNPSRIAMLEVFRRAGARVEWTLDRESAGGAGEPAGTLRIEFADCRSFVVPPDEVPGVIDEIPALAALAAMMPAGHTFTVRGAGELRVKESDRITALAQGFRALGASVEEYDDGFTLEARQLTGGAVDAAGDHRLAMAFAIAATRASAPTAISGASSVDVSYPGFFDELARLTR